MSFTQNTLSKSSTGYAHKVSGQQWIYSSTTDDLATITADGYFDDAASLFSVGEVFTVLDSTFEGDLLEIFEINPTAPKIKTRGFVSAGSIPDGSITTPKLANEAVTTAKIDSFAITDVLLAPAAVRSVSIQDGAVITAKILNDAVTKSKLSPGIVADFKVPVVVTAVTTGGNIVEFFSVPGALVATDEVIVFTKDGAAAVLVRKGKVNADNSVEVEFSADPGAGRTMLFTIFRPAT